MLKARIRYKIYIAIFAFALIVAAFLGTYTGTRLFYPPHTAETAQKTENKSAENEQWTDQWIEFWTRTAIDTVLVIFTGLIAAFALWQVTESRSASKKQLRAYVQLEDIFFLYQGENRTDGEFRLFTNIAKLRIRNYGQTPAFDVAVWVGRTEVAIPDENHIPVYKLTPTHAAQILAPNQRFGPRLPVQNGFGSNDTFFIHGKIVYRDLYEEWWVTFFVYRYGPNTHGANGFAPYGKNYNRKCGPYRQKPS